MRENLPGPGNYELSNMKKKRNVEFGKAQRFKETKSETPGPGQYRIPCSIREIPNYTNGKFEKNYDFI